jgi:hypothetical protein
MNKPVRDAALPGDPGHYPQADLALPIVFNGWMRYLPVMEQKQDSKQSPFRARSPIERDAEREYSKSFGPKPIQQEGMRRT